MVEIQNLEKRKEKREKRKEKRKKRKGKRENREERIGKFSVHVGARIIWMMRSDELHVW